VFEVLLDLYLEFLGLERLDHEIAGAPLDRGNRFVDATDAGYDDDGDVGIEHPDFRNELETVHAGHREV